jgi:cell division protein FtsI/penicillin-binding protein 2
MRRLRSIHLFFAFAASLVFVAPRARAAHPVDLRSARISEHGVVAKIDGAEVKLTLDPELQRAAVHLLDASGAHEGAIVASDVTTGRILAWASRGPKDYVSQAFAPSASLFKVVTASALLEGNKASPNTRVCFDGGEHGITQKELDARGSICSTMGEALGHSYNLVFAKLAAEKLAPNDLSRFANQLGFAGEAPIDVGVGASDLTIPSDRLGLAQASAGFWNGHLTPLGALFGMQTIANGGERIKLQVIDRGHATTRTSDGRAISSKTAQELVRMMEITTRRGTAAKAFRLPNGMPALGSIPVAAKTGTLVGGHPSRMYSWFGGFAPSTKPQIAVVVMLGNDVSWRTKANIVGRELMQAYFKVPTNDSKPHAAVAHHPVNGASTSDKRRGRSGK